MPTINTLARADGYGNLLGTIPARPMLACQNVAGFYPFLPTMILGLLPQGRVASLRLRPGGSFFWQLSGGMDAPALEGAFGTGSGGLS